MAHIMIIGEAPGKKENESGLPFFGPSGRVLDNLLLEAGAATRGSDVRTEVYVTNLVMCWPKDDRTPVKDEIDACWPRVMRQIQIIDPDLVMAVGATALGKLMGVRNASILKHRGNIIECTLDGDLSPFTVPVMPVVHPAHILRNPDSSVGGLLYHAANDFADAFDAVDRVREVWYGEKPPSRRRS